MDLSWLRFAKDDVAPIHEKIRISTARAGCSEGIRWSAARRWFAGGDTLCTRKTGIFSALLREQTWRQTLRMRKRRMGLDTAQHLAEVPGRRKSRGLSNILCIPSSTTGLRNSRRPPPNRMRPPRAPHRIGNIPAVTVMGAVGGEEEESDGNYPGKDPAIPRLLTSPRYCRQT